MSGPPFFSGRLRRDPYAVYRDIRDAPGLHHSPTGVWVISRHDDARAVLMAPGFSSTGWVGRADDSAPRSIFGPRRASGGAEGTDALMRTWLIFTDPPRHALLRRALGPAITSRALATVRPRLEAIVAGVLDELPPSGPVDLVPTFARAVSGRVAAALVGIPTADAERVASWSTSVALSLEPFLDRATSARVAVDLKELTRFVTDLVEDRTLQRGEDLVSDLLGHDGLEQSDVVSLVVLVIAASQETTASMLATAVHLLLTHPAALAAARSSGRWDAVVEEALRQDAPVQMVLRQATEEQVIDGTTVRADEHVLVVLGAANRDPATHPDPDRFDPARDDGRHVAFGAGIHACPGAALATHEGEVALRLLFERYPALALAGSPDRAPYVGVRSIAHLPVVLA
jgi:cytochrome P450